MVTGLLHPSFVSHRPPLVSKLFVLHHQWEFQPPITGWPSWLPKTVVAQLYHPGLPASTEYSRTHSKLPYSKGSNPRQTIHEATIEEFAEFTSFDSTQHCFKLVPSTRIEALTVLATAIATIHYGLWVQASVKSWESVAVKLGDYCYLPDYARYCCCPYSADSAPAYPDYRELFSHELSSCFTDGFAIVAAFGASFLAF